MPCGEAPADGWCVVDLLGYKARQGADIREPGELLGSMLQPGYMDIFAECGERAEDPAELIKAWLADYQEW